MKKVLLMSLLLVFSASIVMAATVSGIVTDSETGEAIEDAQVIFCFTDSLVLIRGGHHGGGNGGGHGGGPNGGCAVTTTTDANGYYEISDVDEGIYTAKARKSGEYSRQQIEDIEVVEPGVTVDFQLTPCTGIGNLFGLFGRR